MKKIIVSILFLVLVTANIKASEIQLETIGAATGSNLVIIYVALGMAGDSYAKNVYSKKEANDISEMINGQITLMKERLTKLIKSKELTSDDQVFVKKMVEIYEVLGNQATALSNFINKAKNSDMKKYDKYRLESQKMIGELLNPKK